MIIRKPGWTTQRWLRSRRDYLGLAADRETIIHNRRRDRDTVRELSGRSRQRRRVTIDYDAFISYNREADADLALAIQTALQRLCKPWYRLRATRIFRDDADLLPGTRLRETVVSALDRSRFFILLASEKAAESEWVDWEISHWLNNENPLENLVVVLTQGSDIAISLPGRIRSFAAAEVNYIDLRMLGDTARARLTLGDDAFYVGVVGIAARIRGTTKDAVSSEELRYRRGALRLALGAIGLFFFLTVTGATLAWVAAVKWQAANHERRVALHQRDVAISAQLIGQADAIGDLEPNLAQQFRLVADALAPSPTTLGALVAHQGLPGSITAPADVTGLATTPDGQVLAIAGTDRVELWNLHQHAVVGVLDSDSIGKRGLAFSADGSRLAVASPTDVRVWDTSRASYPVPLVDLRVDMSRAITFVADNRALAGVGRDGTVRVDGIAENTSPTTISKITRDPMDDAVAAAGGWLALASKGNLRLWDVRNPSHLVLDAVAPERPTDSRLLALGPDGHQIATADADGAVHLWSISGRTLVPAATPIPGAATLGRYHPGLSSPPSAFSADGRTLYAEAGTAVSILDTEGLARPGQNSAAPGLKQAADGVYLGAAGSLAATTTPGHGVLLWRPGGQNSDLATLPDAAPVTSISISPDGSTVATGDEHGLVSRWNIRDPSHLNRYPAVHLDGAVKSVLLSPDLRRMLTLTTTGEEALWKITDAGPPTIEQGSTGVTGVAFSPRGDRAILSGGSVITVVRIPLNANDVYWGFPSPAAGATAVAVSPDSRTVAVGETTGRIDLWSVPALGESAATGTLISGPGAVTAVAFSPDGQFLAGATRDGTIKLWYIAEHSSAEPFATLPFRAGVPQALTFNNKQKTLLVTSDGGILESWSLDRVKIRGKMCGAIGDLLAETDWKRYVPSLPYERAC